MDHVHDSAGALAKLFLGPEDKPLAAQRVCGGRPLDYQGYARIAFAVGGIEDAVDAGASIHQVDVGRAG